jgi:hypothetical protein
MPWSGIDDLPPAFANIPAGAKRLALAAGNSVKEKGGSDEEAIIAMWGAIKNKYKKEGDTWVALESDINLESRKFTKEVIRVGNYTYGGEPLNITSERLAKWVDNFHKSKFKVSVPYRHSQNPQDNTGWVKDLRIDGDRLLADMEITDNDTARKLEDGSIQDVSVGVEYDVTDEYGNKYKELVRHVALTVIPHINNQEGFIAMENSKVYTVGGDKPMEKENIIEAVVEGIKRAFKKDDLTLESKENMDALKLEMKVKSDKVIELETKLSGFQKAADETAIKAWDSAFDAAVLAHKATPAQKPILLEAFPAVEKLTAWLDTVTPSVAIQLEAGTKVTPPNTVKKIENPDNAAKVAKLRSEGYSDDKIETQLD